MSTQAPCEPYANALARLGVPFRVGHHWAHRGYVITSDMNGVPLLGGGKGSGHRRYLDAEERQHLDHMVSMVRLGWTPEAAARMSRSWAAVR